MTKQNKRRSWWTDQVRILDQYEVDNREELLSFEPIRVVELRADDVIVSRELVELMLQYMRVAYEDDKSSRPTCSGLIDELEAALKS